MTSSTTRSQAAAKQIQMNYLLVRDHPMMGQVAEEELASVIASHYAELEAAAVLARDALAAANLQIDHLETMRFMGVGPTPATLTREIINEVTEALAALDAALGATQRINTNVERTDL